jgi:DNA helicase-2/ATP-dependent DNA helicase PcrA
MKKSGGTLRPEEIRTPKSVGLSAFGFPFMSRDSVPFPAAVNLQIDYAGELNPQQHAAVTAPPGPALVIAGAGSGKTRTLTYRVAYLLERGVAPERILLLTFTNKAAREMMRRVADLLGGDMGNLWGGTFHSIGARVLRLHAETVGYRTDFTILDREDATELIKACLLDEPISANKNDFPKADVLGEIFSMAVNTRQSIATTIARSFKYFDPFVREIDEVARRYAQRKRAANVMDFDDLLAWWVELMQNHPSVAELYQRRFEFILVDEYQDTNRLQADLIDLVAERHQNVMVVGDDAQSIYSWRGADFRNILEFPVRYPAARTYKIENNYRSTPEILTVANAAIAPNVHQFTKTLTPLRKSGVKPALVVCGDASQQAAFVAHRILELREEGTSLNSMAILYRSHFHALEVQLELARRRIPIDITSGIRFFEQAHIKDVAAYVKLIVNPMDELAFKRLARLLPGIGEKAAVRLWLRFSEELTRLSLAAWDPDASPGRPSLAEAMQKSVAAVPKKALAAWAAYTTTISQIEVEAIRDKPSALIRHVLEAGYEEHLRANYTNYRRRKEDLEQLSNFALQFNGSEEFLTQLSLLSDVEAEANKPGPEEEAQVRLSTVHQAKGLEFDVVFLIMMCDGLFPASRSLEDPLGEEEERRLFYVGITRAKNELYLSYPLIRLARGRPADITQPSRFLKDIRGDLVNEWELVSFQAY